MSSFSTSRLEVPVGVLRTMGSLMEADQVAGGDRRGQQEALGGLDPRLDEHLELLCRLDPFGDDHQPGRADQGGESLQPLRIGPLRG